MTAVLQSNNVLVGVKACICLLPMTWWSSTPCKPNSANLQAKFHFYNTTSSNWTKHQVMLFQIITGSTDVQYHNVLGGIKVYDSDKNRCTSTTEECKPEDGMAYFIFLKAIQIIPQ